MQLGGSSVSCLLLTRHPGTAGESSFCLAVGWRGGKSRDIRKAVGVCIKHPPLASRPVTCHEDGFHSPETISLFNFQCVILLS